VWDKISLILRFCVKTKAKHVSPSEIAAGLADDSMVFEQAFAQVPVLSFYETLESRTGRFSQRALVKPSHSAGCCSVVADFCLLVVS